MIKIPGEVDQAGVEAGAEMGVVGEGVAMMQMVMVKDREAAAALVGAELEEVHEVHKWDVVVDAGEGEPMPQLQLLVSLIQMTTVRVY